MATQQIKDILDTASAKPFKAFRPTLEAPLSSGTTLNRNGSALTLDPVSRKYEEVSAGTPAIFGSDQGMYFSPATTNEVDYSSAPGQWPKGNGGVGKIAAESIIAGELAQKLVSQNDKFDYIGTSAGTSNGGTQIFRVVIEEQSSGAEPSFQVKSGSVTHIEVQWDWGNQTLSTKTTSSDVKSSRSAGRIVSNYGPNGRRVAHLSFSINGIPNGEAFTLNTFPDRTGGQGAYYLHHVQKANNVHETGLVVVSGTGSNNRPADDVDIPVNDWPTGGYTFFATIEPRTLFDTGGSTWCWVNLSGLSGALAFSFVAKPPEIRDGTNVNKYGGNIEQKKYEKNKIAASILPGEMRTAMNGNSVSGQPHNGNLLNVPNKINLGALQNLHGIIHNFRIVPEIYTASELSTFTA